MSDFALKTAPAPGLRSLLDWFRQARVAVRLAGRPVACHDAPLLADVGLTADQIGRAVDRGSVEIGLLGLGWQQPGGNARR
jgi:hypothetical protein